MKNWKIRFTKALKKVLEIFKIVIKNLFVSILTHLILEFFK